ncbi:family A G protein-coupled receptor-like protein [Neoconidiobolus thromboides FSU 785]|nr:family A G protein-coupled receptor-like protein [Neoconidiobolus thromboides FSU 785]
MGDIEIDQDFISKLTIWWIVVVSVLGLLLNILLIAVLTRKKWTWSIDIKLVLYLSIVDSLLCIIILTVSLAKYYLNIDFNKISPIWCQIAGISVTLMDVCSLVFITLLSFERYFLICKSKANACQWSLTLGMIYIIVGLIFGIMAASTYCFKTTTSGGYCTVSPVENPLGIPYFYYLFVSFNMSLLSVTFCYLNIILTGKKYVGRLTREIGVPRVTLEPLRAKYQSRGERSIFSTSTSASTCVNSNNTQFTTSTNVEPDFQIYPKKMKLKVILRGFLFISIYVTCFIPNLLSWWLSTITFKPWSLVLDIVIICTFNMAQLVNPLLALSLHTTIRREFNNLLKFRK